MKMPYPQAVCLLVLHPNGSVLATSRRNQPSLWGLPGGKVDPGETPLQAIIRESYEETSLTIDSTQLTLCFSSNCGPGADGKIFTTHTYLFTGNTANLHPIAREPGIDVSWQPINSLLTGPFSAYNTTLFSSLNIHNENHN
jgi:8-oxo-dGTP pyrophosphatase MutT (NUDIX family)